MSQDSREKFGVKSQNSIGGAGWGEGGGGGGEKRKERKDILKILKTGQSRGSILCVNGVMHYKA